MEHMDHSVHTDHGAHMDHMDHNAHMHHTDHTVQGRADHNHGDGDGGMMMAMSFFFSTQSTVLFDAWTFDSVGGLIGSMIGIFFMAALYEGIKYYREYLFWRTYNALQYRSVNIPAEKGVSTEENHIVQPTMFSWIHLYQTFLQIIQMVLSYFLMLIFMTYNAWLCIAVVLGAAVGYFLFGWKKSVIVDVTEHCH